jgi:hypothetical protein
LASQFSRRASTRREDRGWPRGACTNLLRRLNVDVSYFFEGTDNSVEMTERQRQMLELARNFIVMRSRRHQEEIVALARALAEPDS